MIAIRAVLNATTLAAVLTIARIAQAADPPAIPWHSQTATALHVARAQQKMLLIYYRGVCDTCNDAMDAMFVSAASDEVFTHTFDTYLPLRVIAGYGTRPHPITNELAAVGEVPLIAVYDASGAQLMVRKGKVAWSAFVEDLLRLRGERPRVVRSVELRRGGQEPEADLLLGNALLNARQAAPAADRLQRASKGFRAVNAEELAQMAELFEGGAWYLAGQKGRGRKMINDVLRKPATDAVAAEAHVSIARQYEAESMMLATAIPGALPSTSARPGSRGGAVPTPSGGTARSRVMNSKRVMVKAIESYRMAY